MKHKSESKTTIDRIGTLDIVDGRKVLIVALKDETLSYDVEEMLDKMMGMTVQFKSEDPLIEE